jgi:hypothetical protein
MAARGRRPIAGEPTKTAEEYAAELGRRQFTRNGSLPERYIQDGLGEVQLE